MRTSEIIREYYNENFEGEWNRIAGRPEFILTCRYIDRYIKPGDSVLDIGGGPGRYSLYLAKKGCDVTLLDLSDENVKFAATKAEELKLPLKAIQGNALEADELVTEKFDHVLLMGPLYHLPEESERIKAVDSAMKVLKPGGVIFVSFINMFAGMIYAMKCEPAIIIDPSETDFHRAVLDNTGFAGQAFTQAFFINQHEVLPFMSQFQLEKLHLFGQEGISAPCEGNIMSQPPDVVAAWMDMCEKLCEREELLSWSEHLMYVGRKM